MLVNRYVWVRVISLISVVKIRLCFRVKWNRLDFLLIILVVV